MGGIVIAQPGVRPGSPTDFKLLDRSERKAVRALPEDRTCRDRLQASVGERPEDVGRSGTLAD